MFDKVVNINSSTSVLERSELLSDSLVTGYCGDAESPNLNTAAGMRDSTCQQLSFLVCALKFRKVMSTGLLDLICSHHMPLTQSDVLNLVALLPHIIISCASLSHCKLVNVPECTSHMHDWMCIPCKQ